MCANCDGEPTLPQAYVIVHTDKATYGVNELLAVTVENRGTDAATLWHCNYRPAFFVQIRVADKWEEAFGVGTTCIGIYDAGQYPFGPGTIYEDTLRLESRVVSPGVYRLSYLIFDNGGKGLYSNVFVVE